jgi:hypothetical protein
MKSEEQNPTPIKLELSRIETVHVTTGTQKVASLCLVLKDSPEVQTLIDHPFPVSKMVITDVIPLKDNADAAEVIFRNLTNQEIVEMTQNLMLPQGTLLEMFGDILETMGIDIELDMDEYEDGPQDHDYDPDDEHAHPEEDDNSNIEVIDIAELIKTASSGSSLPLPEEQEVLYSITMSLAEAHLGQMICVGTNAPAFVLTSENQLAEHKEKTNVWEDFIALLEFPYLDTVEYFDSTASLIQAVTGTFPLNIQAERIDFLRSKLMNDILRLANGSQKALIESFSIMNPLKTLLAKSKLDNREKPTIEDVELFFLHDAIEKIYQKTSPHIVAALINEAPNIEEYVDDIDTVNEIFKNSGLEEIFEDVLESTQGDDIKFLTVPSAKATKEELISFYSASIAPYSFPEKMRGIVPKIHMPILYENNWSSGDAVEETSTNSGEITVAKLITIAVRFSRLKTIVETTGSNLNPIGFLVQGLNFPGEQTVWSFIESVTLLAENDGGDLLFRELLAASIPKLDITEISPNDIIQTAAAVLLHRFGHLVIEEEWNEEAFTLSMNGKPLLNQFLSDVFAAVAKMEEDESEDAEPCPIMIATLAVFGMSPDYKQLVKELGESLKLLAELNALKNTDYTKNSAEWNKYLADYLRGILEVNPNE